MVELLKSREQLQVFYILEHYEASLTNFPGIKGYGSSVMKALLNLDEALYEE